MTMQNLADSTTTAGINPLHFRNAMRRVASSVTIVSSGRADAARGITVTAFSSLSVDPPAVLICVNRTSEIHRTILDTRAFCVNVLKSADEALAGRFAGREGVRGADRFLNRHWTQLITGSPALLEALAVFDCTVRDSIVSGTHSIFIGDVVAVESGAPGQALVYREGAFGVVR